MFVALGCKGDEIIDNALYEKSINVIINQFGQPTNDGTFLLTDSTIYEYQYGLINMFKKELLRNEKIKIRELGWEGEVYSSVVWFIKRDSKWISIANLRWNKKYIHY